MMCQMWQDGKKTITITSSDHFSADLFHRSVDFDRLKWNLGTLSEEISSLHIRHIFGLKFIGAIRVLAAVAIPAFQSRTFCMKRALDSRGKMNSWNIRGHIQKTA